MDEWTTIRVLHARGYGKKTIARMLGVSKNTVKRALAAAEGPRYERQPGPTKVTPFKEQVDHMYFEQGFIGTRIYAEIRKLGYTGSLTPMKNRNHGFG